jgi:hypothetical protein
MNVLELYDKLIDNGYFTSDELDLVTNINGYSIETLSDCIYCRYGYHSWEQMTGEEEEEELDSCWG